MPPSGHLVLVVCLAGLLPALPVGCDRAPDPEADYRAVAARIAGRWHLIRNDGDFHGRPSCVTTLRIDMDSPADSTALVSFCAGEERRVPVEVRHEITGATAPDGRLPCRVTWEPSQGGGPLELWLRWADAVYSESEDAPAFYAEDVLTVEFAGPWRDGQLGALIDYVRDTTAAAASYSPR